MGPQRTRCAERYALAFACAFREREALAYVSWLKWLLLMSEK